MRSFLRFFFGIKKKSLSANNQRAELLTVCSLDFLSQGRTLEPSSGHGRQSQALAGCRACAHGHRLGPPSPLKGGGAARPHQRGSGACLGW